MTEHPYASPDTLLPGESDPSDPFSDRTYCPKCDGDVQTVGDECANCGTDLS